MAQNMGSYRASDLSRGMTLRNASENRRLVGHLQHLDLQLHQNLVNLQAEIIDLKQTRNGMARARPQRAKTTLANTFSDPSTASRQVKDRQIRSASRILPLVVQGSKKDISTPFLPQISSKRTALVSKQAEGVETRPTSSSSRSPASSRRLRELSTDSANLYRPKSTPNLSISPAKLQSRAATSMKIPDPVGGGRRVRSIEKVDKTLQSPRSSEDLSPGAPSLELSDRVSDFLKRPNTSSGERIKERELELKRAGSDVIPTINIEYQEEASDEIVGNPDDVDKKASNEPDDKEFIIDEELFRNSLLLKASRDDGLSSSMPDLASLGFMDFNEVIDQRLRKVKEEIPSEKEMRKIRYLRFRDEPAPLPVLSVFEKENIHELDKIDE